MFLSLYLAFMFILPLSRAGISLFSALIVIVWLIEGNLKEKINKIFANKILLIIMAFIGLSYLSLLQLPQITMEKINEIDYIFLILIPISYTVIKKEWTQKLITAFLIGMFVSEICSYGIYFGWWNLSHGTTNDPTPFMNHIQYSIFLAFTSVLLLSRLFSNYFSKKEKWFILPFFLTVTINLFLTGGRTGQIALIGAIIIMFFLHYKISIKAILLSIVTLGIVYISAYYNSATFKQRVNTTISELNVINKKDLTSSIGIRLTYYMLVNDIFKENRQKMLFGVGQENDFNAIHSILDKNMVNSIYKKEYKLNESFIRTSGTHAQFLQIFLELGIVGLGLLLSLYYFLIKEKYIDIEIKHLAILFVVVFSIASLSDIILELQFTRTLFILFVSLFIVNMKKFDTIKS
jgi:O-antigen ligase